MTSTPIQTNQLEGPVTIRAFLICAFAAFGGIFFGYDAGYINGVLVMESFIEQFQGLDPHTTPPTEFRLPSWKASLITSILSAGNFFGALMAGDVADWIGRRNAVVGGCGVLLCGVVLQVASSSLSVLVPGRLVAGLGVGLVSATIILYMSEIAPAKIRGAIVSGYGFCITVGLMIASCVDYATQNRADSGAYRIPIGVQMLWALILGIGLLFLPESPRYFVKKGKLTQAAKSLSFIRGQAHDSESIQLELTEIIANHQYELQAIPSGGYLTSWNNCFKGTIFLPSSNLRRTLLGMALQMMQQLTGIGFVFYFGTTFFRALGTIKNPFLISMIVSVVNVCSTPISFWAIEKIGRRPLLLWGAFGMAVSQLIVAVISVINSRSMEAVTTMISFICLFIFFFATTWGTVAWVVVGEIFPIPIRSRGIALCTASNWMWNCIVAVITPYLISPDKANLGPKVFFIFGSLCACGFIFTYFMVPETKGLTLEQIDKMMEETTPRSSSAWKPHSTFAAEMDLIEDKLPRPEHVENQEEA